MVDILKHELGLDGNVSSVINQSVEQLGIASEGRPLTQLAAECVALIGYGPKKI